MPPMPPPGGMPAPPEFFFGTSATMASVVISSAATEAAFWIATRSHHGFGGDQQRGHRGRVLDRHANHLGRVDDALRDQVAVFAGLRVEAVGIVILLKDLADDDGTVLACVDRDLAGWIGQRLTDDLDAGLLVVVLGAKPLEVLGGTQ